MGPAPLRRHTRIIFFLAALSFLFPGVHAQEMPVPRPEGVEVRWKIAEGDTILYRFLRKEGATPAPVPALSPLPDSTGIILRGENLQDDGGVLREPGSPLEMVFNVALQVPIGRVREGERFARTLEYGPHRGLGGWKVQLSGEVVDVSPEEVQLRTKFSGSRFRKAAGGPRGSGLREFEGTCETIFDVVEGTVADAKVRILSQTPPKKPPDPQRLIRATPGIGDFRLHRTYILRDGDEAGFRKAINESIDRGAEWIRKEIRAEVGRNLDDRYFQGAVCLMGLTLLICGDRPGDPEVEKVFERIREMPLKETYDLGCGLMAMGAYLEALDGADAEETRTGKERRALDFDWMTRMTERLVSLGTTVGKGKAWGYGRSAGGITDLSNTQYAALGLQAAHRVGVDVTDETWLDLANGVLAFQVMGKPYAVRIERPQDRPDAKAEGAGKGSSGKGDQKTRTRKKSPRDEGTGEKSRVRMSGFIYRPRAGPTGRAPTPRLSMTVAGIATLRMILDVFDRDRGPHLSAKFERRLRMAILGSWAWVAKSLENELGVDDSRWT